MTVKGFTIQQLAEILDINYQAVAQRLRVAGIEPIFSGAIYAPEALEKIKDSPGKGRPKKIKN